MSEFLHLLTNPTLTFLRNAFLAGFLSSILFGIIGSIVTVKRIAGLAGAISHAVLGGIGMALYISAVGILPSIPPIAGALVFAVLSALVIAIVALKAKQREDTVINAIWAIGMSIGVLFMAKTPGYVDPMSYLFGNILFIAERDLYLLAILDVIVIFLVSVFYPHLEASCFDEQFARVKGVHTDFVFIAILIITAIAIVLLQTFVGIVMVIAMLTLPAGTAVFTSKNLWAMMIRASIYSAIFSTAGLSLGWILNAPPGAMTVVFAGAIFLLASGARIVLKRGSK